MIVYALFLDDANKKRFVYEEDVFILMAGKSTIPEDIFDCQPRRKAADWHPPKLRWYDDDGRKIDRYKDPDITCITVMLGSYFLGPRAAELLRPVISDVAELLLIPFQGETWYFMNVFNQINALDKANSRYMVFSTGKVSHVIEDIAFLADKVPHAKLFTIPETNGVRLYYAEHYPDDNPNTFKGAVEKNKLFGIEFSKEWEN